MLIAALFASYPDILDMQLEHLYTDGLMSRVVNDTQQKLHEVAAGSLPHAENVLGALLRKLSLLLAVGGVGRGVGRTEEAKTEEEDEVDAWFGGKKKRGKKGL